MINATSSYPPGFSDSLSVATESVQSEESNNSFLDGSDDHSRIVRLLKLLFWFLLVGSLISFVSFLIIPHVIAFSMMGAFVDIRRLPLNYEPLIDVAPWILFVSFIFLIPVFLYSWTISIISTQTKKSWLIALLSLFTSQLIIPSALYWLVIQSAERFQLASTDGYLSQPFSMSNLGILNILGVITLILLVINWSKFQNSNSISVKPSKKVFITVSTLLIIALINLGSIGVQLAIYDKGRATVTTELGVPPLEPSIPIPGLFVEHFMTTETKEEVLGLAPTSVRTIISTPLSQLEGRKLVIVQETAVGPTFKIEEYIDSIQKDSKEKNTSEIPIASSETGSGTLITAPLGTSQLNVVVFQMRRNNDEKSVVMVISPNASTEEVIKVAQNLVRNLQQQSQ